MKLDRLITLTFFLMLFTMDVYGQTVVQYYVHLLTKAEAASTGVQIGCTCYQSVQWRSAGTTMDGLPVNQRTEPTPVAKPSQTEVYELFEIVGGVEKRRERHTVVVVDLLIKNEPNTIEVMAGRKISFIGRMVNVGNLNIYSVDNVTQSSIVKSWTLNAQSAASPNLMQVYKIMNETGLVNHTVMVQNDMSNSNLVDVWHYSYSVNLKGRNCNSVYEREISSVIPVILNVYKFWITQFKDRTAVNDPSKNWKVVVGRDIVKEVRASPDCTNLMWEMPDLMSNSTDKVWHLQASGSSYLKIPITDLQQIPLTYLKDNPRVKNDDFGNKNGTVKVTCVDGAGNMYSVYSRNPPSGSLTLPSQIAAKVYFERDNDLEGNSTVITVGTPINSFKPLWFLFWKEGNVIDLLHDVEYFNDNRPLYGLTVPIKNGTLITGATVNITSRAIRHSVDKFDKNDISTGALFSYGSTGSHARSVVGCITHENYHKLVLITPGWGEKLNFRPNIESDGDAIPDSEEMNPSPLPTPNPNNLTFPHSRFATNTILQNNADTYNLTSIDASYSDYGDQDLRCRLLQYNITLDNLLFTPPVLGVWVNHYNVNKDWSAVIENLNW